MDMFVPTRDATDMTKRKTDDAAGETAIKKAKHDAGLDKDEAEVNTFGSWDRPTLPPINPRTYALGLFITIFLYVVLRIQMLHLLHPIYLFLSHAFSLVHSLDFQQLDVDYTVGDPAEGLPGSQVGPVPIIRMFGVTQVR